MAIERIETSLLPPFKTKRQDLPDGYTKRTLFTGGVIVLENNRILVRGNKWLLIKRRMIEEEDINRIPLSISLSFPPKAISFRVK